MTITTRDPFARQTGNVPREQFARGLCGFWGVMLLAPCLAPLADVSTSRDQSQKSLKAIAGDYYFGDGLGFNCSLAVKPEGRFTFLWRGCLGVYGRNEGGAKIVNGHLVLTPEQPNDSKGFGGTPTDFIPVHWGERLVFGPKRGWEALLRRGESRPGAADQRSWLFIFAAGRLGEESHRPSQGAGRVEIIPSEKNRPNMRFVPQAARERRGHASRTSRRGGQSVARGSRICAPVESGKMSLLDEMPQVGQTLKIGLERLGTEKFLVQTAGQERIGRYTSNRPCRWDRANFARASACRHWLINLRWRLAGARNDP